MPNRSAKFSVQARLDYTAIREESQRLFGRDQAIRYRREMQEVLKTLASQPGIGRTREELLPELRSFPFQSHTIYFVRRNRGIYVVRILHNRRDAVSEDWDLDPEAEAT